MKQQHLRVMRGALLVSGTCIGGGMLALPVLASLGGFVPALFIYFLCWLFMATTGVLLLEVCHWMEGETNLISMAKFTLGRFGEGVAWCFYLFLFYTLTLAYVVGCGDLLTYALPAIPVAMGPLLFVMLFAPVVYCGARVVSRVNALFMIGLAISYTAFVYMGYSHINDELLLRKEWSLSFVALPLAFASFAYQGVVPTLSRYMDYDYILTRRSILIGSFASFLFYVVWSSLILGIIPVEGEGGLAEALEQGENAVRPLKNFLHNPNVLIAGEFLTFFALVTSFFGVTLGLLDFLADGLNVNKTARGKLALCGLIFVPPLIFASYHPNVFLSALDFAGGFGCAILLGLLPVMMVWSGRYRMGLPLKGWLPGGRICLVVLVVFILAEVAIEILSL